MEENVMELNKKMANPAPLGLLGFGMTTVMLNLCNVGIIELSSAIVAMGIAIGGLAQIIAGIFDMQQGNTFGGTAFTAYGLFWISTVFIWVNPFEEIIFGADEISLGFYMLLWGIFTLFMFIAARKKSVALRMVFLTLTILFFGLAASEFTGIEIILIISGIVGIVCGATAIYTALGTVINEEYCKEVIKLC